ncbi:peptidase [Sphingomonas sp. ABOLE]|uniref:PepSY domain-containing protein n=1 Tax=Sphingomonas sp. ABOLE TaxID=1985878 RepID=UPI000F7E355D|nr:PepSY domain-containing protein [Sphingomonas sp. ABOLE]RSV38634.1 peptidase [Sphingomonas sp. ABOLE]
MPKAVLVLHRWLGVVIGMVMTLWCLSGFVMLYVDYPRLTPAEQVRGLPLLRLPAAATRARIDLPDALPLASARLETMAGRTVLRIVPAAATERRIGQIRAMPVSYDLATGARLAELAPEDFRRIAVDYAAQANIAGAPARIAETGIDQWTVQTFRANRPLIRVDYADPAGTSVYIAGRSGEIVQQTTRFERFWGWLGAVPHWLYPTLLRQNGAAWSQVVIWTSLVGCFLTATGIWVGIARLRRRKDGSFGSPYKGLWWWHHVLGLVFGVLTLSWVASGLLSMNPWGFLDSRAGAAEHQQLAGPMAWGTVRAALARLDRVPADTRRVESVAMAGRVFPIAIGGSGSSMRFDDRGEPAPLRREAVAAALRAGPPLASLDLLTAEDSYYYGHKAPVALPVWRAVRADREATRLYIDAQSGKLLRAVDGNARAFRWLQDGLHRLDLPGLRSRPVWDLVVLPLLAMVTLVCATGTWMGVRKAKRDLRHMLRRRKLGRGPHPRRHGHAARALRHAVTGRW